MSEEEIREAIRDLDEIVVSLKQRVVEAESRLEIKANTHAIGFKIYRDPAPRYGAQAGSAE